MSRGGHWSAQPLAHQGHLPGPRPRRAGSENALRGQVRVRPSPLLPAIPKLAGQSSRYRAPVNSAGLAREALSVRRGVPMHGPLSAPAPRRENTVLTTAAAHAAGVPREGRRAEWGQRTRALCLRAHVAGSQRSPADVWRPLASAGVGARGNRAANGSRVPGQGSADSPAATQRRGHSPLRPSAQSTRGG